MKYSLLLFLLLVQSVFSMEQTKQVEDSVAQIEQALEVCWRAEGARVKGKSFEEIDVILQNSVVQEEIINSRLLEQGPILEHLQNHGHKHRDLIQRAISSRQVWWKKEEVIRPLLSAQNVSVTKELLTIPDVADYVIKVLENKHDDQLIDFLVPIVLENPTVLKQLLMKLLRYSKLHNVHRLMPNLCDNRDFIKELVDDLADMIERDVRDKCRVKKNVVVALTVDRTEDELRVLLAMPLVQAVLEEGVSELESELAPYVPLIAKHGDLKKKVLKKAIIKNLKGVVKKLAPDLTRSADLIKQVLAEVGEYVQSVGLYYRHSSKCSTMATVSADRTDDEWRVLLSAPFFNTGFVEIICPNRDINRVCESGLENKGNDFVSKIHLVAPGSELEKTVLKKALLEGRKKIVKRLIPDVCARAEFVSELLIEFASYIENNNNIRFEKLLANQRAMIALTAERTESELEFLSSNDFVQNAIALYPSKEMLKQLIPDCAVNNSLLNQILENAVQLISNLSESHRRKDERKVKLFLGLLIERTEAEFKRLIAIPCIYSTIAESPRSFSTLSVQFTFVQYIDLAYKVLESTPQSELAPCIPLIGTHLVRRLLESAILKGQSDRVTALMGAEAAKDSLDLLVKSNDHYRVNILLPQIKNLPAGLLSYAMNKGFMVMAQLLLTREDLPLDKEERRKACHYPTLLQSVLARTDDQESLRDMLTYAVQRNLTDVVAIILPKVSTVPSGLLALSMNVEHIAQVLLANKEFVMDTHEGRKVRELKHWDWFKDLMRSKDFEGITPFYRYKLIELKREEAIEVSRADCLYINLLFAVEQDLKDIVEMILRKMKKLPEYLEKVVTDNNEQIVQLLASRKDLPLNQDDRRSICHYPKALEPVLARTDDQESLRDMVEYAVVNNCTEAVKLILSKVEDKSLLPFGLVSAAWQHQNDPLVKVLAETENMPLGTSDMKVMCHNVDLLEKLLERSMSQEVLHEMLTYSVEHSLNVSVERIWPKVESPPAGLVADSTDIDMQMQILEMPNLSLDKRDIKRACGNEGVLAKALTHRVEDKDLCDALEFAIYNNLQEQFKQLRAKYSNRDEFICLVSDTLISAMRQGIKGGSFFVIGELGEELYKVREGGGLIKAAVENECLEVLRALVAIPGASVSKPNDAGDTPLHLACKLLDKVNVEGPDRLMNLYELWWNMVDLFVLAGANVDAVNNDGDTPLHLIAKARSGVCFEDEDAYVYYDGTVFEAAIVRTLANKAKTSLSCKNKEGLTPACLALIHENKNFFENILKKMRSEAYDVVFTDPRNGMRSSLLLLACLAYLNSSSSYGDRIVPVMLNYGASVASEFEDGEEILHRLARVSDVSETEIAALVKAGANVNKKTTTDGYTPLHLAAMFKSFAMIKVLLAGGADASMQNSAGKTALDLARCHVQAKDFLTIKALFDCSGKKRVTFDEK